MTRKTIAYGRANAGEWDVQWRRPSMLVEQPTEVGVLFFHGSGANAFTMSDYLSTNKMGAALARNNVRVLAGDFGYQTWGNDVVIAKANEAMTYLESTLGIDPPYVFVGGSMGNTSSFATANAYPEKCLAIAGVIPLVSIAGIMARGSAAAVNAAYPPSGYDDEVDGPDHSPIHMAGTLDPDLPIHFWCSNDDPLTIPAEAQEFVDARPQTGLTWLGNLGHSNEAIIAATPALSEWVREVREAAA